jgi:hypothetical protein
MEMNKLEIQFVDSNGHTVLKKKLIGIPLLEDIVIARSIEWYRDPEPCMIHRSAVIKTIYLELFDYFSELLKQNINQQQWCSVPDHLKQMLDIRAEVRSILLSE